MSWSMCMKVTRLVLIGFLLPIGCATNNGLNNPQENSIKPTLIEVNNNGFVGEFYAVSGLDKLPAIVVLSGSDGSIATARTLGRPFADLGYAVLVLSYWRAEDLPDTLEEIPIEYFNKAVDWLKDRGEVDPNRIGMLGWSKGAEAALLVASQNDAIKAVLALSPTFAVWPGINFTNPNSVKSSWTLKDEPLAFLPMEYGSVPVRDVERAYLKAVANVNQYPEVIIPVENIQGAVMLLSGDQDKVWPAADMGDRIIQRLQAHNFPYYYQHIVYADAGHAVFVGGPSDPGQFSRLQSFYGGTNEGNSTAWQDSWEQGYTFFETYLK